MATKYAQSLLQSDADRKAEQIEFAVEDAKQQVAADILANRKLISKCKRELADAEAAIPLSPKKIVEKEIELEGYENGLTRLVKIQDRLLSDSSDTAVAAN